MSDDVEALILLIRERKFAEALELLDKHPALAKQRTSQEGQLHGAAPLHWAAHRNGVDVCRRVIELGADVNDSASDWWLTPLAWGADAASVEAVELLLEHGADVNQDAVVGTTALHAAAMGGSSQGKERSEQYRRTAETLIAHGADINRRSGGRSPHTPLEDALASKNEAVAEVLRHHGARVSDSDS